MSPKTDDTTLEERIKEKLKGRAVDYITNLIATLNGKYMGNYNEVYRTKERYNETGLQVETYLMNYNNLSSYLRVGVKVDKGLTVEANGTKHYSGLKWRTYEEFKRAFEEYFKRVKRSMRLSTVEDPKFKPETQNDKLRVEAIAHGKGQTQYTISWDDIRGFQIRLVK